MLLFKEMIFDVRRAVYTFTACLSSKNDNKQSSLPFGKRLFGQPIKKGATGEMQLLCYSNGAETRI